MCGVLYNMMDKATFVRYTDMMTVCAGVLSAVKFVVTRDVAALKTLAAVISATFGAFAVYLAYFSGS